MNVARWNLSSLQLKLKEFSYTRSVRSLEIEDRWRAYDLLSWLLQPRPQDRPKSFTEVLSHAFFDHDKGKWRMSALHVNILKRKDYDSDEMKDLHDLIDDENINSQFHPTGNTPLHIAVFLNNPAIVELLVARGAKTDQQDHAGRTPISYLFERLQLPYYFMAEDYRERQMRALVALCKATEFVDGRMTLAADNQLVVSNEHASRADHLMQACDALKTTPWGKPLMQFLLQKSAANSWIDVCKKLVESGASVDGSSQWDARPPRQIGMASNHPQIREFFQTSGTVGQLICLLCAGLVN